MTRGELFNPRKKEFWLLLGAALLGVFLMLAGGSGSGRGSAEPEQAPPGARTVENGTREAASAVDSVMTAEERVLAAELQRMLEQIAGAGRVEVTVQLATSTHKDYAINSDTGLKTTEEQDQNGGTRRITENTDSATVVITGTGQGLEQPVVRREVAPVVAGVLVVAEGAGTPRVKADLFRAVQVALGVQPHKIMVMNMQGSDSVDQGY